MKRDLKKILAFFIAGVLIASCAKNENEAIGKISSVIGVSYVKALHKGGDITLQKSKLMGASKISGVVISDRTSGNFDDNEFIIQNTNKGTTAGLIIKLNDVNNVINYGDSIVINIENCLLFREQGALKLKGNDLSADKVTKVSANNVPNYKTITQSQLLNEFYNLESTLISLENVTFPDLAIGTTFAGDYRTSDDENIHLFLRTNNAAIFAQKFLPLTASFFVIPTYNNPLSDVYNTAKTVLKMPNEDGVYNKTGVLYLNFPEDFELAPTSSKQDYLMPLINDQVTFKTGDWKIYQGIIGASLNVDKFNPLGKQAIRFQQQLSESAFLEMKFDLLYGASKVTFSYGVPAIGGVVASTIDLEYSTDGGTTWTKTGRSIIDATKDAKEAAFNLNVAGAVRFRINKIGLGPNTSTINNGYINIDDFKVFQNAN